MRRVEKLPIVEELKRTDARDNRLIKYLDEEINDAISAGHEQRQTWELAFRLYNGVPKQAYRKVPLEDAPNIEVTLAAIAVDALYAQALSAVFSVSPLVTVRPVNRDWVPHAKALQRFTNWMAENELDLRNACEHSFMDCVQLGTGVLYTPYVHHIRKTAVRKVEDAGPQAIPVPIEDFLVPGGATADIQRLPWCSIRMWLTDSDLADRSQRRRRANEDEAAFEEDQKDKWDTSGFKPVGSVGWIRSARERMGQTSTGTVKTKRLYEVHLVFCTYDYDRDGIDEDLLVVWDRTSRTLGWVNYCPYTMWPLDAARYQIQAHLFTGLGVVKMMAPYQEEVTESHNDRAANVKLSNTKMFKGRAGAVDEGTLEVWPGRVIQLANPDEDLKEFSLADVNPSAIQHEAASISLAERRVGVNELNTPRPSQVLGSRTPAFTTASLLEKQNVRFMPAYDAMRGMAAGSVRQGLWRYHERLRTERDDGFAAETIRDILGQEEAGLVLELLRREDFERCTAVELTAVSASVNRDSDRQNSVLLMNLLMSYAEKVLQLVTFAAQQGVPAEVVSVAAKVAGVIGEVIDRTVRTFDQVRDPEDFVIQVQDELASLLQQKQTAGIVQQLGQQLGLLAPGQSPLGPDQAGAQQQGNGGLPTA